MKSILLYIKSLAGLFWESVRGQKPFGPPPQPPVNPKK